MLGYRLSGCVCLFYVCVLSMRSVCLPRGLVAWPVCVWVLLMSVFDVHLLMFWYYCKSTHSSSMNLDMVARLDNYILPPILPRALVWGVSSIFLLFSAALGHGMCVSPLRVMRLLLHPYIVLLPAPNYPCATLRESRSDSRLSGPCLITAALVNAPPTTNMPGMPTTQPRPERAPLTTEAQHSPMPGSHTSHPPTWPSSSSHSAPQPRKNQLASHHPHRGAAPRLSIAPTP